MLTHTGYLLRLRAVKKCLLAGAVDGPKMQIDTENKVMCGIVGIISNKPVAGELIEGLRRLEYRGYDFAGIATLVDGRIERRRAEGKLANLAERLEREPLPGTIGIGHTRWATHGVPTERNAHPHRHRQGRRRP